MHSAHYATRGSEYFTFTYVIDTVDEVLKVQWKPWRMECPITSCFLLASMIITFFGCIAESASAVENQLVPDTSTSRFTWCIENFSKRNVRKHYSDDFIVGGYKWWVKTKDMLIASICVLDIYRAWFSAFCCLLAGECSSSPEEIMWNTFQCTWMLLIQTCCLLVGVGMHNSALLW